MAVSKKILSIVVAAYNRGSMIDDCLKSFCDKRCIDDIEVIVVNDGSTDDTVKRAEKYSKKYPKQKASADTATMIHVTMEVRTGKKYMIPNDITSSTTPIKKFDILLLI